MQENKTFTVLENKAIGKNIYMYRKLLDLKASDIAKQLGLKEASYTKYERGETQITIEFVQKVAQIFNLDPLQILTSSPSNFIEHCTHFAVHDYHNNNNNEQNLVM